MNAAALRTRDFQRILLIKPSAVGDVIHTVPVLVRLRQRYPNARIDWLLNPSIAELIRHHPALSGIVHFDRKGLTDLGRGLSALGDMLTEIRQARYDLVIDLHGQFRSALLTLVSGARTRIGFDRPRKAARQAERQLPRSAYLHGWTGAREGAWVAYTHRIPIPTLDAHAVDRYLWLAPMLGLAGGPPDFTLPLPEKARNRVQELLGRNGLLGRPLAVLVPGTVWETKHWHTDGFAEVARHWVATRGGAVAVAGTAAERPRCRAVVAACPGACDLSGQTVLTELAALIERADVCVTNDSGSMHLTVALGRPVVSIFGPTDPVWIGPYGRPHAVAQANLSCAPCYLRKLRHCPHDHACMSGVSGSMVIERLERVLANWSHGVAA